MYDNTVHPNYMMVCGMHTHMLPGIAMKEQHCWNFCYETNSV